MKARWGLVLVGAVGILAGGASAQDDIGTVISHNGSAASTPIGTGEVDVDFGYPPWFAEYHEVAGHEVTFAYAESDKTRLLASEWIFNRTSVPWAGFRIELSGADFAGHSSPLLQAPEIDPVMDIGFNPGDLDTIDRQFIGLQHLPGAFFTLESSSITRTNDQGAGFLDAELLINFGSPLEIDRSFVLHYFIFPPAGDPDSAGFSMTLTPIPIPEPATVLLLGAGLVGIMRRRPSVG